MIVLFSQYEVQYFVIMYEDYPWIVWIRFSFLLLSLLAYAYMFLLIGQSKLFRSYSGQLVITMACSQICIILPILIVPYFTNPSGDTRNNDIIGNSICLVQGHLILFGWLTATSFSILDCMIVLRLLKSQSYSKQRHIGSILIVYAIGGGFLLFLHYFGEIGPTYIGKDRDDYIYMFCTTTNRAIQYILLCLDLLSLVAIVWLCCKIKNQRDFIMASLGFNCDQYLIDVHFLALAQISMWSINMLTKFLIQVSDEIAQWKVTQFFSSLYYLEGLLMLILCLNLYAGKFRYVPRWAIRMAQLLMCCKCGNRLKDDSLIFESSVIDNSSNN